MRIQRARSGIAFVTPDLVQNDVTRDCLVDISDNEQQQIVLATSHLQGVTRAPDIAVFDIDFNIAKANSPFAARCRRPRDITNSGEAHALAGWPRDVVVDACLWPQSLFRGLDVAP